MKTHLSGRVVLITGASSGLGEEIAYEAVKSGAQVILCARRMDRLKHVATKCRELSNNEKIHMYPLDLSSEESIKSCLDKVKRDVGKIDILVNNAGVGLFAPFLDITKEQTVQMMEVNVLGMISLTKRVAKTMMKSHSGHIIIVASQAAKMSTPKSSVYSATKFAALGYANALRLELKPYNVFVTTVNPGPIKTEFFDHADPTGTYLASVGSLALEPSKLAKKIVKSMWKKKREINTPTVMSLGSIGYQLFPRTGDFLAGTLFNKK